MTTSSDLEVSRFAIFFRHEKSFWSPLIQNLLFKHGYSWFLKDQNLRDFTGYRLTIYNHIFEIRADNGTYDKAYSIPGDIKELQTALYTYESIHRFPKLTYENISDKVFCYKSLIMNTLPDETEIEAYVGNYYKVYAVDEESFDFINESDVPHEITYETNHWFRPVNESELWLN